MGSDGTMRNHIGILGQLPQNIPIISVQRSLGIQAGAGRVFPHQTNVGCLMAELGNTIASVLCELVALRRSSHLNGGIKRFHFSRRRITDQRAGFQIVVALIVFRVITTCLFASRGSTGPTGIEKIRGGSPFIVNRLVCMGGVATGHVTSGMEDLSIVLHAMQKRVVLQASPAVTVPWWLCEVAWDTSCHPSMMSTATK